MNFIFVNMSLLQYTIPTTEVKQTHIIDTIRTPIVCI